jgi:predicted Rossmann fold flavoprotein
MSCFVAGGGAAGFFAAITCAEENSSADVTLFEATAHPLSKVRISGGGRCNVTHACFDPRELSLGYPRGGRELLGPFHQWQPRDTAAWFAERGVELKTEDDRRMFPVTDDSATVVECLLEAAEKAGVRVRTRVGIKSAERVGPAGQGYRVHFTTGEAMNCDRLLLATGGGKSSAGLAIAQSLGHHIEPPVPSLFTFHIDDPRLKGLEGISVTDATSRLPGTRLSARGPVLVTHWGLSGPSILKLSAWAARELAACDYRFCVVINWRGNSTAAEVLAELSAQRTAHPRRQIASWNPLSIPARLWERLVGAAGISPEIVWTSLSNAALQALAAQVTSGEFAVTGKSLNKEEFVTCGGVRLDEVDFRTMESRRSPGLYLAGEVLDIDGVTGGFNLQAAWTTGRLAGLAMACRED